MPRSMASFFLVVPLQLPLTQLIVSMVETTAGEHAISVALRLFVHSYSSYIKGVFLNEKGLSKMLQ